MTTTTTMTESEAFQAILAHHQSLSDGVARRAGAVQDAVGRGAGWGLAAATLVAYLAGEVLPHAAAEEASIYQTARARPGLDQPIAGMIDEHRVLAGATERLATTESGDEAGDLAARINALFASHVRQENEVILPTLGAELPALVTDMHRLTEPAPGDAVAEGPAAPDVAARLTSLLLDATSGLADAGDGDRACRLAAGAWSALRVSRPDLAVRVTAKLHHLVKAVTAQPVTLTSGPRSGATAAGGGARLDVRALAPAQRHETIFATYGALAPGTGFVLVNDHDPKPLRYQFEAEHAGDFTWEALEEGPTVWRVRIGRAATVQS